MAVDYVVEDRSKRTGSGAVTGQRTYLRVFQVHTDSDATGPMAVRAAVPVAYKDPYTNGVDPSDPDYEHDPGSFCQSKGESCVSEDGCTWEVQVNYAPYDVDSQDDENPLLIRPDLDFDGTEYERVLDQDVAGVALLNSAGDPFDPPLTRPDSRQVLAISRNEASFNQANVRSYLNHTNDATFYGWPAGCAKCTKFKGTRKEHPTYGEYWAVDYEITFDPEGWDKPILNAGLREMVGSERKAILTKDGHPITSPVPLAEDGTKLPPDGDPVFLTFTLHEQADFSAFDFPGA